MKLDGGPPAKKGGGTLENPGGASPEERRIIVEGKEDPFLRGRRRLGARVYDVRGGVPYAAQRSCEWKKTRSSKGKLIMTGGLQGPGGAL